MKRLSLVCFISITSRSGTSRVVPLTKYFCLLIRKANYILIIVSGSSVMVEGDELILC